MGSAKIGMFLPSNMVLQVMRVLSNGDTRITSGLILSMTWRAYKHCSLPLLVMGQSTKSGLYLTPFKKSYYLDSSSHMYGRFFFTLNQCEAQFIKDYACLINIISQSYGMFCLVQLCIYILFINQTHSFVVQIRFQFKLILSLLPQKMKNDRDQQIRLHHQKWKKWKGQIKNQGAKIGNKIEQKPVQSTQAYTAKLIGKLENEQIKPVDNLATNKIKKQFQNNSCSNCLQLMIPPRNPMTLFPCGHNMCKICLTGNNPKSKTLQIKKCALCTNNISNFAVNISLMNLICAYTNNTHLLAKQKQQMKQQEETQDPSSQEAINRLKLRCLILEKQKKAINGVIAKQTKDKQILGEVMNKLKEEKKKNSQQLEAAYKQSKLIQDFLNLKKDQLEKIKSRMSIAEQKRRVVDKTLQPLKIQKQKMRMLEVAKMANKDNKDNK